MSRTQSFRRHKRFSVQRKRSGIMYNVWHTDREEILEGRLDKNNLVCSCDMCRDPKYRDTRTRVNVSHELEKY